MSTPAPTSQPRHDERSGWLPVAVVVAVLVLGWSLLWPILSTLSRIPRPLSVVKADIKALEGALAEFKAHFGEYPPSRITLYNNAEGWNSDPRSKAIIRKYWPQFDFNSDGAGGKLPFPAGADSVTLDGAECLVFFLGGVRDKSGVFTGFAKDPREPFSPEGLRLGPFVELYQTRLIDIDGDEFPEYLDPLPGQTRPYVYYNTYGGNGYEAADEIFGLTAYTQPGGTPWRNKTFQIISPGADKNYGPGGLYDPDTADAALIGNRKTERDNITNFSAGRLAD